MAAPTPASAESPGADYRGRHRTAEDLAEPVAAVVVTGSDVRIEPLDGLIRAHGFTGRAGTVQI